MVVLFGVNMGVQYWCNHGDHKVLKVMTLGWCGFVRPGIRGQLMVWDDIVWHLMVCALDGIELHGIVWMDGWDGMILNGII